jgi:hypothetical protein
MRDKKTERDVGKHVARFILIGLYTGTRHAAICGAAFHEAIGCGHIDLGCGIFQQAPACACRSACSRILRRWHRLGIATHTVVEWNGSRCAR